MLSLLFCRGIQLYQRSLEMCKLKGQISQALLNIHGNFNSIKYFDYPNNTKLQWEIPNVANFQAAWPIEFRYLICIIN